MEAGSREAYLIQQPLAAAIGVDLPINSPLEI
jgi:actin-like ATPase involved in cell morphogenesis